MTYNLRNLIDSLLIIYFDHLTSSFFIVFIYRLDKHVYAAGNTAKLNLEFQTTRAFSLKVRSLEVKVVHFAT